MRQNVITKRKCGKKPKYTESYMRMAVEAYILEEFSYPEIKERYNVPRSTFYEYHHRLKEEILQSHGIGMQNKTQDQEVAVTSVETESIDLALALDNAKQRIAALEVLIMVAEEELGINLRKKYGTKQ